MVTGKKMAEEWHDAAMLRLKTFKAEELLPALREANDGAVDDVFNTNGCANYQWGACLVDVMKPKQVVELGGAMGVWDICILHTLPKESKLWSITLPEGGLEFKYVVDDYPNFKPIVGDDLDLDNWPKELDLKKTDLWYFDSLHTGKQLQAELDLYTQYFKEGAVLLFDDIRMEELWPIWEALPYDKYENTDPCHYTGYGIAVV